MGWAGVARRCAEGWSQRALGYVSAEVRVGRPAGADLEERQPKNSECSPSEGRGKGLEERLERVPAVRHSRKEGCVCFRGLLCPERCCVVGCHGLSSGFWMQSGIY